MTPQSPIARPAPALRVLATCALAACGLAQAQVDKRSADVIQTMDGDGDGRISAVEYTASPGKTRAEFDRIDADRDGYITPAELDAHTGARHDANDAGRDPATSTPADRS